MPLYDDVNPPVRTSFRIGVSLLALLVRIFSTTSRPALRAAACGAAATGEPVDHYRGGSNRQAGQFVLIGCGLTHIGMAP